MRVQDTGTTLIVWGREAAICLSFLISFWIAACGSGGGGGGSNNPPPSKTTPSVTVTPAQQNFSTVQTLQVTVTVNGSSGTPTGSVTLTSGSYSSAATALSNGSAQINIAAGTLGAGTVTLSASYTPDASSSSAYNSSSGSSGQVTITKATPTVSVTPASSSVLAPQTLNVTVAVSGGMGAPSATGSVVLSGGGYTSSTTMLSGGSSQVAIPAGALAAGAITLSATYIPDTAGSAIYASASGNAPVTVSLVTPTVTVSPGSSSISTSSPLSVTVTVAWGAGNPTPSGSVTLSGGGYTSSSAALNASGSATINIPANSLPAGNVTLTANYTADTAGAKMYSNASGTGSVTVSPVTYTLTVNSSPSNGASIGASPQDNNHTSGGTTQFTLTYNSGTVVTLTAPATYNANSFASWSGCTSSSGVTCSMTVTANATVTAVYTNISSITVSPTAATIGTQQQFTATVNGTGNFSKAVTWSLSCSACGALSAGTLSSSGMYNTPYPAPASVTITATSVQNTSISGFATVTLNAPATAAGPALTVDVNTPNTPAENPHNISPYVYGMNGYLLDTASEKIANPGLIRWGGDATSRYNYKNSWTNSAADWYFENFPNEGSMFPNAGSSSNFPQFFQGTDAAGAASLGTVPVLGWVSNGTNACSFSQSSYPNQVGQNGYAAFNSYNGQQCGYGAYANGYGGCTSANGCSIYGNNSIAAITSTQETPPSITDSSTPLPGSSSSVLATWANGTWSGGWVNSIVTNPSYGNGASGKGVAMWDLDNEPTWWDAVHRDVHPVAFTYDEVTNNGIGTALAIKTADPTALVGGPVIDYWYAYFYSKKDIENGWSSGPCYQPWSGPVDRQTHGGIPLIEYYLQQFAKYSSPSYYNMRLLDYLDIHSYFAPSYNGSSVAFTTAGDTQVQVARMNGTRVFWDPSYTDPNLPQPNYVGDSNYTSSCSPPLQAPQVVRMLKFWVARDYPGTKTAIDEYNFGATESINGALVEADILGIFGREGLDMSAFWPTAGYSSQGPGNYAFAMYRNYDLKNDGSTFGDVYLQAASTASGTDAENRLAIYGAQRSNDSAITILVINKTYGSLTSSIGLQNFSAAGGTMAQVYQYSNANLNSIAPLAAVSVTPPTGSGTTSTIGNYTFPAQSITLFVVP